jgi:hypothetical protein
MPRYERREPSSMGLRVASISSFAERSKPWGQQGARCGMSESVGTTRIKRDVGHALRALSPTVMPMARMVRMSTQLRRVPFFIR